MNYYRLKIHAVDALVVQTGPVRDSETTKRGKSAGQVMPARIIKLLPGHSALMYHVGYESTFYAHICTPVTEEELFLELI
jgi:hypothetical protein